MKKSGIFLVLVVCFLALGLLSCDGSSDGGGGGGGGGSSSGVVGTWIGNESFDEMGMAGTISVNSNLRANETYTAVINVTFPPPYDILNQNETDNGTYKVDGNTITFNRGDGETIIGTINGNKMTMTVQGYTIVLTKQ